MRLSTTLTVLLAVFVFQLTNAQDFKFGKVSKAEVEEKEHPLEKEAEAAYLYNYRNSYYSVLGERTVLTTEIHKRIKIYSDEGFPYAEFNIYLNDGKNGLETLTGLKAYTYNLENGKVEEYKLDKKDIFRDKQSEFRTKVTFTMPNVKEGSVVEVRYKKTSDYYFSIAPYRFQFGIPVKNLKAKFSAPESFVFNTRNKGYYMVSPQITKKNNPTTGTVDVLYTFDHENIPSLKEEAFVDNIDNYRSGMDFELSVINIPGRYFKSFTQTWEDVTKFIYDSGLETELNKEGYFKDELDPLLANATTDAARIVTVLEFVKGKMNWDKTYGYRARHGVRKAFKDGVGNVADINLMLTAMLRYAGVQANPVLVSTKAHGVPLFPTSDGFNYVISAVESEGKVVMLDATSKLSVPDILPYRVLNWNGRLIREDGSSTSVDLSATEKGVSRINLSVKLNEDGSVDGRVRRQYFNHLAYKFRNEYEYAAEEEYLEDLENELAEIEVDNYGISNKNDPYKPVVENFEFHKEVGVESVSGKLILSPLLFLTSSENPFTSETRVYPVDFQYPKTYDYSINYMLPEGYQVESLPESAKFVLPDNLGVFVYQIANQGNILQIRVHTSINADIVTSDYYGPLKTFFGDIIAKENEKVVITKV